MSFASHGWKRKLKTFKCEDCILCQRSTQPVPGEGPDNAKVLLIGEAPGINEDQACRPFIGRAGHLLMHIIGKLGLKRSDFFITNVLKCYPGGDKLPTGKKLDECLEACKKHLVVELVQKDTLDKRHIVLLGGVAMKCFSGNSLITKFNGMKIQKNTWATFHPSSILRPKTPKRREVDIYRTVYKACIRAKLPVKKQGWDYGVYGYED